MASTLRKVRALDSYMVHIHAFPLKRIRTAAEHAAAKRVYLRLSGGKADQGTRQYLDVLVDLIADFERRMEEQAGWADVTAAELVQHRLHERGMSVSELARQVGMQQSNLSEMLSGRRDWSKAAIRGISRMFSIRAERFLA
jgi:antitoxin component HigA of HigAB toxin-antitoxin module